MAKRLDPALKADGTFEYQANQFKKDGYSPSFGTFAEFEQEASELYVFEHSLVSGLVQTKAYARAVIATRPGICTTEIDRMVAARMERQAILTRNDPAPPYLWVLLDESVLHRPLAPAPVMHEQLMHLTEVSRLPNVSIGVVPYTAGGHIGLLGAFTIAEQLGHPRAVNMEDITDGRVSEDPALTREVALRFKSLQMEALGAEPTRDLIAEVAAERWKTAARTGERALTAVTPAGSV